MSDSDAPHQYDGQPVSYGAGVNSTALVILLAQEGWRGPILFADTGTEWPETVEYIAVFGAWLAERDLEVTVVGPEWRRGKEKMTLIDYCEHYRVTPFPGARWCTSRWKVEPLQRWCEAKGYGFEDLLLGISADEAHRQPERDRPLVDRGIDRNGCARIIAGAGLPIPRKSGCWICPFQSVSEWRALWRAHPDLFERAVRLEGAATERRRDGQITHFSVGRGITLRELAVGFESQMEMFDWLEYYQPCMCRI